MPAKTKLAHLTPDEKRLLHHAQSKAWRRQNPERMLLLRKRWKTYDPVKCRAQNKVHRAVRSGKLVRGPCVQCGAPNGDGHHEDYSKPLDVVWMCPTCHNTMHNERRAAERKRRRHLLFY